jgi:hypothetical protein
LQGPAAGRRFIVDDPLGQALLRRVNSSAVARSVDGANRAASRVAGAAASKLAGPVQNLTRAVAGLRSTVARNATSLALRGAAEAVGAYAPLLELRANATQRVAEPIKAAGQRLAEASFQDLVRQVQALPAGPERDAAVRQLAASQQGQRQQRQQQEKPKRTSGAGDGVNGAG